MKYLLPIIVILALFSIGCFRWTGDGPAYYQRTIPNNPQFVPGHPRSWWTPILKEVRIGNPLTVNMKIRVHCVDWLPDESYYYVLKPQDEFAALVAGTYADEYEAGCDVISWHRLR